MKNNNWKSDILALLDKALEDYSFPLPNNSNYPSVAMRLSTFRSDQEWLLVFEAITWSVPLGSFDNLLYAYGDKISKTGIQASKNVIKESSKNPLWDEDMNFLAQYMEGDIYINDKKFNVNLSAEDYVEIGLEADSPMPAELQFLAVLTARYRNEFFMGDETLLKHLGKEGLQKFLVLDEWFHPNCIDDEMPSDNPCMKSLAAALASNDVNLYKCPKNKINTSWHHWDYD